MIQVATMNVLAAFLFPIGPTIWSQREKRGSRPTYEPSESSGQVELPYVHAVYFSFHPSLA